MSSCTEYIAPSMKTTHSSNGSFYDKVGTADQPSFSFTATTPEPYMGITESMPVPDWISKNLSFITETEDTPSLSSSSSFDFTNALMDEFPSWEDISYHPSNYVCSTNRKDFSESFEPHHLADISSVPWPPWPSWPPNNLDQLLPTTETPLEARIPIFPEYQTSDWQEKVNNQTRKPVKPSSVPFDHLQPLTNEMIHSMPMTSSTPCFATATSPIAISVPVYQASGMPFETYDIQPSTSLESSNTLTSLHLKTEPALTRNVDSRVPIVETRFPTNQHQHQNQHQYQHQNSQTQTHSHFNTHAQPQPQLRFTPPKRLEASLHPIDRSNAFLIDCKRRGLSYKDIKRIGNFKEAESTLRGRFRTLTKSKDQRVRKPIWLEKDVSPSRFCFLFLVPEEKNPADIVLIQIQLLCKAVGICEKAGSESLDEDDMGWSSDILEGHRQYPRLNKSQPPKVSWKKVAGYISKHGGSYQFGNATCKKKWCEIHDIPI
ncbi:hypothetical protein N7478_000296 [Penicillium angulare]|uniref:uncharacterized protein n=1 Tax=Penicillium angulare TaxID=116970 RepID=UPI002540DA2D|nr:uncharacterized protein N7478_000296 [Penicillium angulare]KAJ5291045.1 hypothetical protein N7478_000296 [Penicillium angulare]